MGATIRLLRAAPRSARPRRARSRRGRGRCRGRAWPGRGRARPRSSRAPGPRRRAQCRLGQPHLGLGLHHVGLRLARAAAQLVGVDLGQELALADEVALLDQHAAPGGPRAPRRRSPRRPDRRPRGLRRPRGACAARRACAAAAVARRAAEAGPARLDRARVQSAAAPERPIGERRPSLFFMMAPLDATPPAGRRGSHHAVGDRAHLRIVGDDDAALAPPPSRGRGRGRGSACRRRCRGSRWARRPGAPAAAGERARDGDALLLSAREVARQEVRRSPSPTRSSTRVASSCAARPRMPFTFSAYSTFSSAVRAGNRLYCWNTKPIERRRTSRSCAAPRRVDASRPRPSSSPEVGVRMQPMIESSVVLPEPEGPSSATTSPGATVHARRRAAPRRAASPPRRPSRRRVDCQHGLRSRSWRLLSR